MWSEQASEVDLLHINLLRFLSKIKEKTLLKIDGEKFSLLLKTKTNTRKINPALIIPQ